MLHESWTESANDINKSMNDQAYTAGYLEGVSDFQERAIKELEKLKQDDIISIIPDCLSGVNRCILIIKSLRAE